MGRTCCNGIVRNFRSSVWFKGSLCFLFLISLHAHVISQHVQRQSPAGTKFWAYTPPSYSPSVAAPVLVSLHGGSGIGDDLNILTQQIQGSQDNGHQTPARLIFNNQWNTSRPFIVISPQLKRDLDILDPNDQEWPPALIDEVIEYVKTQYNVDATRIYVTGISLGGAGTWSYATSYPDKVAAIVPIAGVARIDQACALKNVPVWVFHGENDALVVPAFSIDMIDAINNCPDLTYKPRLTTIPAQAHEGWNGVFTGKHGYDIFSWFLKFRKGNASNKAPHVSAMGNKKILLPSGQFFIPADYFDSDGTITSIVWEKVSGPAVVIDEDNGAVLKISSLTTGTYTFRITVTDNGGLSSSDTMQLTVTNGEAVPQILSFSLTDGNETVIRALTNNDVINLSLSGGQINIMANANASARSIKFSVNVFDSIRTTNLPNNGQQSAPLVTPQTSWKPTSNEYYVCATPYSATAAAGTKGISLCYKLTIGSSTYYAKHNSDITLLSSWGTNPDGSGTAPASLSSAPLNLIIPGIGNITSQNMIVHELAKVIVKSGGTLNFQRNLLFIRDGKQFAFTNITAEDNSTIRVNIDNVALNKNGLNSTTVIESNAAVKIPVATYGNLILKGSGAKALWNGATVTVRKKLTIEGNTQVNNANPNNSEFLVLGDVEILSTSNFVPTLPFAIRFGWAGTQTLKLTPARSVFQHIKIGKGATVNVTYAGTPGIVELSSTTAGEVTILENGSLKLNGGTLSLKNDAAINPLNEKGTIDLQNATLLLDVSTARSSNLYAKRGAHTLKALESNLLGGGQLQVRDSLKIGEYLKVSNGTIQSNGFLTFVSTPTFSAYIAPITGTGTVAGNVNIERTIESGRKYKYFGFPVKNVTVAKLQQTVPVTGPFPQSSPGYTTAPSLFFYNEPANGWKNYPVSSNNEVLQLGRGYALFMRNESSPIKMKVSGPIHQGDFAFTLTPDPNVNFDEEGWNLLGNPYIAPIEWKTTGWTRSGVSTSVYVRDNSVEGGRFLVWDGTVGQDEFRGIISSGQAFWVRTTSTTPALTITEAAKVNRGNVIHYGVEDGEEVSFLRFDLRSNDLEDNVFLKFNDAGGLTFLTEHDAMKQRNGYFNISALTTDSVHTVIKNLPKGLCSYSIPLRLEGVTAGAYTLSVAGTALGINAGAIVVFDRFTGNSSPLKSGTAYHFSVNDDPKSSDISRFSLLITNDAQPVITVSEGILTSDTETGNQWFFNGTPISGATQQTLHVNAAGEYQLQVQRGSCTIMSQPVLVNITGIEPAKRVSIYPNPASTELQIKGINNGTGYTIHGISGADVARGQLSGLDNESTIGVGHLSPGVYYLSLSAFPGKKWKIVIR